METLSCARSYLAANENVLTENRNKTKVQALYVKREQDGRIPFEPLNPAVPETS